MDDARFDAIARFLAVGGTRRGLVGGLLATLLTQEGATPLAAKKSKRGNKRNAKRGKKRGANRSKPIRGERKPPPKPAKPSPGNDDCAAFCTAVFPPGPERGACVSAAASGEPGNLCAACAADPKRLCDGECRDLQNDPTHCGGCNQPCTTDDGECAGRCQGGQCAYPSADAACGSAATCADGTATSRGRCDGAGGCAPGVETTCAPYRCGADACLETCDGDDDCLGNAYCNGANRCVGDEADGAACQHGGQCQSGHCANKVCCAVPCAGECEACNLDGSVGACRPVTGGNCGNGGACNNGQCEEPKANGEACAQDSECRSGHCTDGVCCDTACGGQCKACNLQGSVGACSSVTGGSCGSDGTCEDGECVEPKVIGEACTQNAECASNRCTDGVCCNTDCDGACKACNLPNAPGICSPISGGSCGNGGSCEGGECVVDDGCGTCGQLVPCGQIVIFGSSHDCRSLRKSNGECACTAGIWPGSGCTLDSECAHISPNFPIVCLDGEAINADGLCPFPYEGGWDGTNVCAIDCKKAAGRVCQAAAECASGFCTDGVCCRSACEGECQACNVAGFEGACKGLSGVGCRRGGTCANGVCSTTDPLCFHETTDYDNTCVAIRTCAPDQCAHICRDGQIFCAKRSGFVDGSFYNACTERTCTGDNDCAYGSAPGYFCAPAPCCGDGVRHCMRRCS